MLAVHLTFGLTIGLLSVLAVFLCFGKATILINGMMFMPKEARDRINKKAIGRFSALILVFVNLTMIPMWIDIALLETKNLWLTLLATGIMLIGAIIFSIIGYTKREKWFSIKKEQTDETDSSSR